MLVCNTDMYYRVLVASQQFHGLESLTYQAARQLELGQLVTVPLQRKTVLGIVEGKASKPSFTTKSITTAWPLSLPETSLALHAWLQQYYPAPVGILTELFTPPALPKELPALSPKKLSPLKPASLPALTPEQVKILKDLGQLEPSSVLLHGDTGTGKTRIYVELAQKTLAAGKSAIVLTPEIGLTQPLGQTFTEVFKDRVLVTHSDMTPAQRRAVWLTAQASEGGLVIIGPRSALFSPLKNVGLIIMDECHDGAYKQEQAPYYQASRVAAFLAQLHDARLVLGSATPLITDYFAFQQKKLPILRMIDPAIPVTQKTKVKIIDQRDKNQFTRSPWLANKLVEAIHAAIENKEQALLFLNRRGSARLVLCEQCGWQALCPHCDVALTYHADQHSMRCHSCDFRDIVPTSCPSCGAQELVFRSIGTKALEAELGRLFATAHISRFDRDTEKKKRLAEQYKALHAGDIDILVGTQTIAKGFDLPNLSVVGIIQADSGLQIPDYTAAERTYQLLSQVSGRIGRGHRAGRLFLQTFNPENPLIAFALDKSYEGFYKAEITQRQLYNFPPYSFLLKVTCIRASQRSAELACQQIAERLTSKYRDIAVDGPTPRFIEKRAGRYAWHVVIKAKNRTKLLEITQDLPSNCIYDLDPSDLL